jgi:hypothetical protein
MRQKSTTGTQLAGDSDLRVHGRSTTRLVHDPGASTRRTVLYRLARGAAAATDRVQPGRDAAVAAAAAFASPPPPCSNLRHPQFLSCRLGRRQKHDLGSPPLPALIALRLMRDHAGRLEVVEPALHALAMRTHEPRPLHAPARHLAPAHHRRQPHDKLLDGRREPTRVRGVTEPEQVALDRVRTRLQAIVTRRRASPRPARASQERVHHQAARLGGQWRARRSIPTTTWRLAAVKRCAFQRHRQRPRPPGARTSRQRSRADARGAAGPAPSSRERASTGARRPHPRNRGWRSVRRTATVAGQGIWSRSSRSGRWLEDRSGRPGCKPVFLVLRRS